MKYLYEIPKDSIIVVQSDGAGAYRVVFDHIDGMYSYCYLEEDRSKIVHLSASTPLRLCEDGTYEIDNTQK